MESKIHKKLHSKNIIKIKKKKKMVMFYEKISKKIYRIL